MIRFLFNIVYSLLYWVRRKGTVRGAVKYTALVVLVFVLAFSSSAHPEALAGRSDAVEFPDANLMQALKDNGADADGDGILTEGELAQLTGALDLSRRSIIDLTGLELADNLTELNLSGNAVTNIAPLTALDKLITLNLSDNQILDIGTLYNADNPPEALALTWLDVSNNYLSTADGSAARQVIDALRTAGVAVIFDPQKPIPALGVELNAHELDMCPGDTATLSASVWPEGAVNQNISWQTSGAAALVEGGVITAVSEGQAVITVTTQDGGWTDTCVVSVKPGKLSSEVYQLSPEQIYVKPLTNANRFYENMANSPEDMVLLNADGDAVSDGNAVTGMTARLTVGGIVRDERTLVVKGDVNGDGVVSVKDFTLISLHLKGIKTLEGAFALAADYDTDGLAAAADLELLRVHFADTEPAGAGLVNLPDVADPQLRAFLDAAMAQLGKPYIWGAEGPKGFDCSGYIYYCLQQAGYDVDRLTADMYSRNKKWTYVDKNDLQPGDLMFYYSNEKDDGDHIGHVGIYLGNGYHIHASSDYGCIIVCGVQGWYKSALAFGRRVFE